jgi:hypothetical protein
MKTRSLILSCVCATAVFSNANAQLFTIEPDSYADRTILNRVLPQVNLFTVDSSNWWYIFDVTARDDSGYAPTGIRDFAQANVPFWNNDRRLRMDFNEPVSFVSIAFAGGDYFTNDFGRLEIYNSAGALLSSYVTAPLTQGVVETMALSRQAGDIAWAVAYTGPGGGVFGRLDNLQFQVAPEPSCATLLLVAGSAWLARRIKSTARPSTPLK